MRASRSCSACCAGDIGLANDEPVTREIVTARFGREFGVSRSHVHQFLDDAMAAGLISRLDIGLIRIETKLKVQMRAMIIDMFAVQREIGQMAEQAVDMPRIAAVAA